MLHNKNNNSDKLEQISVSIFIYVHGNPKCLFYHKVQNITFPVGKSIKKQFNGMLSTKDNKKYIHCLFV